MIERFRAASPARQLLVAAVAAAVATMVLAALWFAFVRVRYEPLFTQMRGLDAATIVAELDKRKIAYRLTEGGATILVPADKVDATRLAVMTEDLPIKGTVGFELFNSSDMGLTDFAQKINYQRALQGELARTIATLAGVDSARVHLSLGEDRIFRDNRVPPKASVTMHMRDGVALLPRVAQGIQRLVAAAVPQLEVANVVILDAEGDVIGAQTHETAAEASSPFLHERSAIEQFYEARIKKALARAYPSGGMDVAVRADIAEADDPSDLPEWTPAARTFPLRVTLSSPVPPSTQLRSDVRGMVKDAIGYDESLSDGISFTTAGADPEPPLVEQLLRSSVAGNAADRTTSFTYDHNGRRLTESRAAVVASTVDANGALASAATAPATISYTYNALGEVTRKTEATGDYTEYTYDVMGRQTAMTSSAFTDYNNVSVQRSTANAYDGLNNLTRTVQRDKAGLQAARVTTYGYDAGGHLKTMTDPGHVTNDEYSGLHKYDYDIAGRLVREYVLRRNSAGADVAFEGVATDYDAAGRVVGQGMRVWNGSTWTSTEETRTAYNAYGEVVGRGTNATTQEAFKYDAGGRVWYSTAGDGTVKLFLYDGAGNATLTISSSGGALQSGYDWSTITIDQAVALLTNNGNAAIGTVAVPGMVVTINVVDKRGLSTETREPRRETTAIGANAATISHQRRYNAFGEVRQEIDARGNTTDFTYNTLGKVTRQESPTVSYTLANGAVTSGRPTQNNYYDLSGRLVGVDDANGNRNTRSLLAGTGYGGEEAAVLKEFHADGGVFANRYDVFDDLRTTVNEVGKTEAYVYDNLGRLVAQQHQIRPANSPGNPTGSDVVLIDYYAYDALGQRTRHWNSQLGSGAAETTDYDAQGRVTKTVDMAGHVTTARYEWWSNYQTVGLGNFGALTKWTTNAAGKEMTEWTDYFGRLIDHFDYGGHNIDYSFDRAGRLTQRTNNVGESINYSYYNTGLIASMVSGYDDGSSGSTVTSSYKYDVDGNRAFEGYAATGYWTDYWANAPVQYTTSHQAATVTWDAANRMTSFVDTGASGSNPVNITYEYDLAGNVRHVASTYRALDPQGNTYSGNSSQDYWYNYDSMNRFTTTKGVLNGARGQGTITRGLGADAAPAGTDITYDLSGQRTSTTSTVHYHSESELPTGGTVVIDYTLDHKEQYSYTADGYLAAVDVSDNPPDAAPSSTPLATYGRDAMGRLTSYSEYSGGSTVYSRSAVYDAASQVTSDHVTSARNDGNWVSDTTYDYNLESTTSPGTFNGLWQGGVVTHQRTTASKNGASQPTTDTKNSYVWWDGALQSQTLFKPNVAQGTTNTSTFNYNASGFIESVYIQDGRPRTVSFITDGSGQILQRDEADNSSAGDPRELHYYFGGMQVGDISNNGTSDVDYGAVVQQRMVAPGTGPFRNGSAYSAPYADFDQSYDPINAGSSGSEGAATRYTVKAGDTLEAIALQLWGDASFWYMIADANGLSSSDQLQAGMVLSIPNKVHNVHNNTDSYRVYDPNEAIGDTAPTAAKPPKAAHRKCGLFMRADACRWQATTRGGMPIPSRRRDRCSPAFRSLIAHVREVAEVAPSRRRSGRPARAQMRRSPRRRPTVSRSARGSPRSRLPRSAFRRQTHARHRQGRDR